jgi:transposase
MSSTAVLTDDQWERIHPLLPSSDGKRGRPFSDDRPVVEGILFRYRWAIAWREVPEEFGPWQTVWKRHRRYCADGTWDRILAALLTDADKVGLIDWAVSVNPTINQVHQHAANFARDAGSGINLHQSVRRGG